MKKINPILFLILVFLIAALASCKRKDCENKYSGSVYKICWIEGQYEGCEETYDYNQGTGFIEYKPNGSKCTKRRFGSFTIEQIR